MLIVYTTFSNKYKNALNNVGDNDIYLMFKRHR